MRPARVGGGCGAARPALLPALLVLAAVLVPGCRRPAPAGDLIGLADLVQPGETLVMARALPGGDKEPGVVLVTRTADSHDELRVGERRDGRWSVVHASRPGDEFRNLQVEDVNADGHPEIVARWAGGQIEIVEVLGRGGDGVWKPLLQNGSEVIEERRRPDRTVAFWLTGRTYEEEPGHPPVYETTVYRWDGSAFTEERQAR